MQSTPTNTPSKTATNGRGLDKAPPKLAKLMLYCHTCYKKFERSEETLSCGHCPNCLTPWGNNKETPFTKAPTAAPKPKRPARPGWRPSRFTNSTTSPQASAAASLKKNVKRRNRRARKAERRLRQMADSLRHTIEERQNEPKQSKLSRLPQSEAHDTSQDEFSDEAIQEGGDGTEKMVEGGLAEVWQDEGMAEGGLAEVWQDEE